MKKTFFILLLTVILFPLWGADKDEKKTVLVLGFSSPVMDEIEERFMREEVLRGLARRKAAFVSVMATEALIRSRQNFRAGSVTAAEMNKMARAAGATLVIAGNVICSNCTKKSITGIDPRCIYRCTIVVYFSESENSVSFSLERKGEKDRYRFLRAFSREIVAALAAKKML